MMILRFVYILLFFCVSCTPSEKPNGRSFHVLVSIAPYKFVVERIAGDVVTVNMMVPAGGSPHAYEPTAKQILQAATSDIWFRMGEQFELRALPALTSTNPEMIVTDLRDGIDLISIEGEGHVCHHHDCQDPHIWLNPLLVKEQAERITNTLVRTYPENEEKFQENLKQLKKDLDSLDQEIRKDLQGKENLTIMVSHPAYAYFSKEYGLKQLPIEFEGKEPSPKQLTKTLETARKLGIKTIYIQQQHLGKGSRLFAKELGAKVVELDPLAENYLENMRKIARHFANDE